MKESEVTAFVPPFLLYSSIYHFVITDLDGKYLYVNQHFKQQFSFLTDDFRGLPFSTTIHKDDVAKCQNAINECVAKIRKAVTVQVRKHKGQEDGGFYLMTWEFSLIKNEKEEEIGLSCLGYDVTEMELMKSHLFAQERKIKEELLLSERKLRAILDSTQETNILISKDLKVMSFNKTAQEAIAVAFGVKIKEGDDFRRYVLREQEENFFKAFNAALSGTPTEREATIGMPNADVWFRFKHLPVYSEEYEIIGVSFCVENIDNQKRIEEKLLQTKNDLQSKNQLLSAILESPKGIIIFSLDKEYRYLSFTKTHQEVMKHIWGVDIEINKCMLDYIKDPQDREKAMQHFKRVLTGEYFSEIEEYGDVNLYRTHWENRYSPMYNGEDKEEIIGLTVFVTDITERMKNEARVTLQNEKLRAIAWQQSHEVRRPVASILGLINLIQQEKSHERAWELYFEYLYKSTEELDNIIRRIVSDANEFN